MSTSFADYVQGQHTALARENSELRERLTFVEQTNKKLLARQPPNALEKTVVFQQRHIEQLERRIKYLEGVPSTEPDNASSTEDVEMADAEMDDGKDLPTPAHTTVVAAPTLDGSPSNSASGTKFASIFSIDGMHVQPQDIIGAVLAAEASEAPRKRAHDAPLTLLEAWVEPPAKRMTRSMAASSALSPIVISSSSPPHKKSRSSAR